ncbi:MAG: DUF5063 domain-containing protein [Muribaculaceae bacterium]|nr:DUF5063 domain-containing protein [Muribaculaceae bacterium]
MEQTESTRGAIAFIALATEYCSAIEGAAQADKEEFVALMLRLLPRIYITISDITPAPALEEYEPLQPYLDAETYEQMRSNIACLLGEDDSYLESFSQDMQYSEETIPATVSESLADLYQPLLDCALAVRDSEGALTDHAVVWARETFAEYWGQTLTNVLRALHHIYYK